METGSSSETMVPCTSPKDLHIQQHSCDYLTFTSINYEQAVMFACKVFGCKETEKSGLIYFV
jgi:hypothetical protein